MTPWLLSALVALLPMSFASRLAKAEWTWRHPRAALALWQAVALSAGLGVITAGLVAAVAPLDAVFPHGMHTFVRQLAWGHGFHGLGWAEFAALAWSAGVLVWLTAHTARAAVVALAERRRQRLLVDVAAEHLPDSDVYVLPSARRLAYCVPGAGGRVVLSQGAIDSLSTAELQAVLRHERAHAKGRHDLVLLPFVALAKAFAWLPFARTARQAVAVLLEMIADDHARDPIPLARALVAMTAPAPAGGLGVADAGVVERVRRLLARGRQAVWWVSVLVYSSALLVLSGPVAVLVAPWLVWDCHPSADLLTCVPDSRT
ncbi:M48 family metalloprotease [Herbidospora sp. NEAU-GS84]|uniref:M48 family metalloprotease n=1 Tax=Herbidospora solisilvae TaxID=2696284 RepID=A0A7C9NFH1_9ACTN|nr:M56 family metallopeptidase [Herbidospora solisilvae]NAS23615.1 M48 family metalloprotease [Herbidospora solisilvae]